MIKKIDNNLIESAETFLSVNFIEFKELILKYKPCNLAQSNGNPFQSLVRSIISQQLSNKASKTIFERINDYFDNNITPEKIAICKPDDFRIYGVSNSKAKYIIGLAMNIVEDKIDFDKICNLPDNKVIHEISQINGIGKWTAEMFLIFCLRRPDVVSLTDVGIQRAVQNVFKLKEKPTEKQLLKISSKWKPYRSIACWYLWRSLG